MPKKGANKKVSKGPIKVKGKRARTARRAGLSAVKVIIPVVVIGFLAVGIGFFALSGYETATGSQFFHLRGVDIEGTERTSRDEVHRVVTAAVEKPGVWNADLAEVKLKLEKFPFVRSASVSRSLPARIHVHIVEREPAAVVKLSSGNFLVDTEGVVLAQVKKPEPGFPFMLHGWDESKTEKAVPENLARIKLYRKMLEDAEQFDLTKFVRHLDLKSVREPIAVIQESGNSIEVSLARDNLGRSLKTALEAITGKGSRIRSVDSAGIHPIIQYLDF